jgi:hypothetical protein
MSKAEYEKFLKEEEGSNAKAQDIIYEHNRMGEYSLSFI